MNNFDDDLIRLPRIRGLLDEYFHVNYRGELLIHQSNLVDNFKYLQAEELRDHLLRQAEHHQANILGLLLSLMIIREADHHLGN